MENVENMEELDNIIELIDEQGNEVAFEYLDVIEYEGKEYIVLLPAEEGSDEILILEIVPVGEDEESFESIEDENILQAVFAIFKEKFKDIFDFAE